jgi:hypothetical protein
MLIKGDLSSDKTEILVREYARLLNSGVSAREILVLVQNSALKRKFIEQTFAQLTIDAVEGLRVHSFFGLVYNAVVDNWAFLESRNPAPGAQILPNLTGLEVSQFVLKNILKEVPFEGYNSKKSLLHQLFRRYSLIVQNNLSDAEVDKRSAVLKESFAPDARAALKKFMSETLRLRDFDYLRQTMLFNYIYKNTDYFADIKYLILDDGDEITPVCFDFVKHLAPQLKDMFIAYDPDGASRSGYLSADRTLTPALSQWEREKNLASIRTSSFSGEGLRFTFQSLSKRASMLEAACKKINELGTADIAIVTPVIDDMLKFTLRENLRGANLVFLSGSEKLVQDKFVKAALTILKFPNVDEFELRALLSFLGIPLKYCCEVLENFGTPHEFPLEEYTQKYNKLCEFVAGPRAGALSEQGYEIFK